MSTFVGPDGEVDEEYFERTHKRFVQWIDDTCNRTYDRDWLNYQYEIALRHHRAKKNGDGRCGIDGDRPGGGIW